MDKAVLNNLINHISDEGVICEIEDYFNKLNEKLEQSEQRYKKLKQKYEYIRKSEATWCSNLVKSKLRVIELEKVIRKAHTEFLDWHLYDVGITLREALDSLTTNKDSK